MEARLNAKGLSRFFDNLQGGMRIQVIEWNVCKWTLFISYLLFVSWELQAQQTLDFTLHLQTHDAIFGRKSTKKPRSFAEVEQRAKINMNIAKDTIHVWTTIEELRYNILEEQFPKNRRIQFDSKQANFGHPIIQKYAPRFLNTPFLLLYNASGELINQSTVYGWEPMQQFELENETGGMDTHTYHLMLTPKVSLAEALGNMIQLNKIDALLLEDTVRISDEPLHSTLDTSVVYVRKTGFPFTTRLTQEETHFSFNTETLQDEDTFVVKNRTGLELMVERRKELLISSSTVIFEDTLQKKWYSKITQEITLTPQLWLLHLVSEEHKKLSGDFNLRGFSHRKQVMDVVYD